MITKLDFRFQDFFGIQGQEPVLGIVLNLRDRSNVDA